MSVLIMQKTRPSITTLSSVTRDKKMLNVNSILFFILTPGATLSEPHYRSHTTGATLTVSKWE